METVQPDHPEPKREPIKEMSRREVDFPTDPNERFDRLLQVINTPVKMATMIGLYTQLGSSGNYLTSDELPEIYRKLARGSELETIDKSSSRNAILHTLSPIGAVAEVLTQDEWGNDSVVGFALTKGGAHYGMLATALTLDFEKKHETSVHPILGQTNSNSKEGVRSPTVTAHILGYLRNQPDSVRIEDIFHALKPKLGATSQITIANNLWRLRQNGMVSYESVNSWTGQTQVEYIMHPHERTAQFAKKLPSFQTSSQLTHAVYDVCYQLIPFGTPISAGHVTQLLVDSKIYKGKMEAESLRETVSNILSFFASKEQGILERGKYKARETYSQIGITDKGIEITDEFISPLMALCQDDNDTVSKLKAIRASVVLNPRTYIHASLDHYYPYSRSFARKNQNQAREMRRLDILACFTDGKKLMLSEVAEILAISKETVRVDFHQLLKDKKIEITEIKNGVRYFRAK